MVGMFFYLQLRSYLEEMDTVGSVCEHLTYMTRRNNTGLLNGEPFQLQ
jgi:hypothetical protein